MAGNRCGKTTCTTYELTLHLTGLLYPESWWEGKRFDHAISAWAVGNRNVTVRDILQNGLIGKIAREPNDKPDEIIGLGTGMIPAISFAPIKNKQGLANAVEIVYVKDVSGGTSILTFKSYESGRESFEGTEIQVIAMDEEPPMDVYVES